MRTLLPEEVWMWVPGPSCCGPECDPECRQLSGWSREREGACREPRATVLLLLLLFEEPDGPSALQICSPRISEKFLPYPRHKDAVKKEKRFLEKCKIKGLLPQVGVAVGSLWMTDIPAECTRICFLGLPYSSIWWMGWEGGGEVCIQRWE